MKYSIKIIILLSVILSSCKQDDSYSTFTIQNSSNHYVFFEVADQQINVTAIADSGSYMWTVPEGEDWSVSNADSVRIHFDSYNSKVMTYYNYWLIADSTFNLERNPINTAFFSEECIRGDGCDYTYVITEEDYENAEIVKSSKSTQIGDFMFSEN